jgi:hypothetical protein
VSKKGTFLLYRERILEAAVQFKRDGRLNDAIVAYSNLRQLIEAYPEP